MGIGDLENEKPMYGRPIEEIRYKGLSETDIPYFKKSDRHDLNDIPDYESYKEKLKVRDANRYWMLNLSYGLFLNKNWIVILN